MSTYSKAQPHKRLRAQRKADAFFNEHGWTRVPRLVQWIATIRCPLSCEHCLAAGDNAKDMTAVAAARLIEQVAGLGVEEFLVTGGEPLARPDLPEIVGMLHANAVPWSLNTALKPNRRLRAAIERWPPRFVAVSIDGPEKIHDAFRGRAGVFCEAMESMAYFAGVVPGGVAAGTTVTTKNFRHLPATFAIVLGSGAAQWGLHLPVPEGRAARRNDLFLSRTQLKELLRFAASKRSHFPVTMADEIGYCGFWEPLVRSEPFFCGAGKVQCVVLPDGEVVPCTTLDRTTSAGNVLRQPLCEIWETGFTSLRLWQPGDRCRSCSYAVACDGGCWLQRRHRTECFRDVWRMPQFATAATVAVCLGLAASGVAVRAERNGAGQSVASMADAEAGPMQILQSSIVQWYASQFRGSRAPDGAQVKADLKRALPDDPGATFFLRFADDKLPEKIEDRAKEISVALQTKQRSLCLVGIAWRAVTEWCLANAPPARRTEVERKALREVTALLGQTAESWRAEIFRDKLDPFLRRPDHYRNFFLSKAGPTALQIVSGDLAQKRWSGGREITEQFLADHPYAETMNLKFALSDEVKLQCLRHGKTADTDGTLRVFDLLLVPKQNGAKPIVLTFSGAVQPVVVTLPPETELTYGDVLALAHPQNGMLYDGGHFVRLLLPLKPLRASPFALPELLKQKRAFEAKPENAGRPLPYQLLWPLCDLYLF